jgi:hypothetical protein
MIPFGSLFHKLFPFRHFLGGGKGYAVDALERIIVGIAKKVG